MPEHETTHRFRLMSVEEAEMWVSLMGRREAERYYPGILALIDAADRRRSQGVRANA
jgi:hypothetical protein